MAEEQGFRIASAYVEVSPDTSDFREKLQEQLDEAVAGVSADVTVGLDTAQLDADADDVKAKIDELNDLRAEPTIAANDDDLKAKVDGARADLDDLDGKRAEATLAANDDDLKAKVDGARADLDDLDSKRAEPEIGAEDADFNAKIAAANAELTALNARSANPSIGGSGGGAGAGGGAAAGAEAGGEGSLVGALGLGIGSLLPGIGGAVAGMGLLGATGLAAFGGVGKALSAHSQATQNVGITGAQMAATTFANTVAIQQAQLAVGQAYRQAAENAIMSAEQQQSAEGQLAETVRNAAQAQIQAVQSVTQAQQQEQQATFSLSQAQFNLSEAWIQARYALEQLKDQEQNRAATVQAATVAVEQAQYQQKLTNENALSTSLDRAQASVAVTQAQEQLTAAQQQATYTNQQYQLQEKQGVAGSQQVLGAQEAVKAAVFALRDARMQTADAERNLTVTEKNNAEQIKQAQLAVTEAQQQGAFQQQQDTLAIRQAQQNVTNTLKEQQLQLRATQSTANSALNQFNKDMSRLGGPARELVRELLSMSGAWRQIERIAQGAVAPGITEFLKGVKSILPEIGSGVGQMGKAMGDSFGQFGKVMQTPAFREGFSGLLRNGVQFSNIVLPAFAQFLQMLGRVGGQQGAATGIANLFAGIAHGLTGMTAALRPYLPAINQFLTAVGHILAAIGPPLGVIIGQVANALGPLTRYLDAHPNGTVVKVIGDIVAGLLAFKGLQKLLPDFISGPLGKLASKGGDLLMKPFKDAASAIPGLLGKAWSAAGSGFIRVFGDGGLIGQGFAKFGGMLSSAGSAVATFVTNMASQLARAAVATGTWIAEHTVAAGAFIAENVTMAASATAAFIAENAATLGLVAAIGAVVGAVVYLGTHWHEVWDAIKTAALDIWHNVLDPMWHGISAGIEWLWNNALHPYFDAWKNEFNVIADVAMWLWHNVLDPVWQGIMSGVHAFVSGFETVWHRLESIFKNPVNFLIGTVYDKGIARFWNDIVGHIGLSSLKLPVIPTLATGGIVPGRDTGRDNQLVAMRSGEGVLVPEAVQAIGPGTVHRLNSMYGRGGSSPADGSRGFSNGGIFGDIGGFFTSVGRGIVDSAKFMADFATDPVGAVTSLLDKTIGTSAAGDLGKVMTAIPKTLVSDLASLVAGAGSGGGTGNVPGGSSTAVGNLPANWHTIASFLASHGFTKYAAAGVAGNVDAESGGDPEILEAGGGGGGGLIQWTPYPPGYITGDSQKDLYTQLNAILAWGGGPGMVNKATSPSNAALIYQDDYERPASLTASLPTRMAAANAVYQAMGWGSVSQPQLVGKRFDSGGWLMPDGMPGVNQTGQPEAVLTPAQSEALVRLAANLPAAGGGTKEPVANFNYFGTQYPSAEVRAMQRRDAALAFSGVGL